MGSSMATHLRLGIFPSLHSTQQAQARRSLDVSMHSSKLMLESSLPIMGTLATKVYLSCTLTDDKFFIDSFSS